MASAEYTVRLATFSDFDSIVSLVREDFMREETMHRSFALNNDDLHEEDLYDQLFKNIKTYFFELLLTSNPALVACEVSTGQVVGFLVLQIQAVPNLDDNFTYYSPRKSQRCVLDKLNSYHYEICQNADISARFPETKKHMLVMYLAVQQYHRGKGLATMILQQAIEHAKTNGCDVVYGIFTSEGSKRTAEKLGMTIFFEKDLMAIVDHEGQPMFADVGENNVVSVMGIKIN